MLRTRFDSDSLKDTPKGGENDMTSGHALLSELTPKPSVRTKPSSSNPKGRRKKGAEIHVGAFRELVQSKKKTKASRLSGVSLTTQGLASATPKKKFGSAMTPSGQKIKREGNNRSHPTAGVRHTKKTGPRQKTGVGSRIRRLSSYKGSLPALLPMALVTIPEATPKARQEAVTGHNIPGQRQGRALGLSGNAKIGFLGAKSEQSLAAHPPMLLLRSRSKQSQNSEAGSTPIDTKPRLVFVHHLRVKRPTVSSSQTSRKKSQSVAKTSAMTNPTSWDAPFTAVAEGRSGPVSMVKSSESRSQPVLGQAVAKGILQRRSGNWVIKPINWRAPAGVNASKWSLTMPKQVGGLIMTLVHMQKSWKVDLQVNSASAAGSLAENLSQASSLTAASQPVSQVSVFLGLGHSQTGQGGGWEAGGLPNQRDSDPQTPPGGPERSQIRSQSQVHSASIRYSRVDYQA